MNALTSGQGARHACHSTGTGTGPDPRHNGLLASLPPAEYRRWLPSLKLVKMPLGQVLHEPGAEMTHVYFPVTAIVSILYVTENGSSAEIALAGNEGLIGIALFMGGATHNHPGGGAKRGRRIPDTGPHDESRLRRGRPGAPPAASLHPGADHADVADGRLQPAPLRPPATVPAAVARPRPVGRHRTVDDAGTDRQHAGREA
jgi:hypothetical protein